MSLHLSTAFIEPNSTQVPTEGSKYGHGYPDPLTEMVAKIYYPIVLAVGLTGNTLNLLVLSRKGMLTISSTIYLLGLSISDIFLMIFQTLFKYIIYKAWGVNSPHGFHVYLCVYNHWLLVGSVRSSFWIVVALTIERYIAITFPFKGKVWCTKSKAKKIVPCVAFAGYSYALYEIWVREVNGKGRCTLTEWGREASDALSVMNATVYTITYVLLLTFNGLVIYQLKKPSARRKLSAATLTHSREHSHNTRGTVVLLVVSGTFLFLNLPWLLNYLLVGMPDNGDEAAEMGTLEICAEFIGALNPTVNFFLYSVLSKRYRSELLILCGRKQPTNRFSSMLRQPSSNAMALSATPSTSTYGGRKVSTVSSASDSGISLSRRRDSSLQEFGLYDTSTSEVTLISVKTKESYL